MTKEIKNEEKEIKKVKKEEPTKEKTVKKEKVEEKTEVKKEKVKEEKKEIPVTTTSSNGGMYMSYNTRLLLKVIIPLVLFVISVVFLISSISIKTKSNVIYRQSSNMDYKVYLKQNDYYNTPYLNKNMVYIASLIDNISVDFNYNFMVNQNINYKYTYYVKADVAVTENGDAKNIIYSKTDNLTKPNTVVKENSSGFTLNETLKIDYDKYNELVKTFKSSYALSADSNLVLTLVMNIEDEKGNMINGSATDVMTLTIPLTQQMVSVKLDQKALNNSNNVAIYKDFSIGNSIFLGLSIVGFLAFLISIVRLFVFLKKTTLKKTEYDITLSKILKEYDRVIVNSKNPVDLNDEIIDVNNFNELLDVRDNLEKPIIFSEIHKGQKSVFIVKTSNETYRYVLKQVDLEKDKK